MTPDADIDGLVRRLRECLIPGDMAMGVPTLPVHHPLMTEAAALIEALRKDRDAAVDACRIGAPVIAKLRMDKHTLTERASAAEQRLAKIEDIASLNASITNSRNESWFKAEFKRIAALARSTSTNGG